MSDYALVVAKQGETTDVEDLVPKLRAFDSRFPCLKILDAGRYNFEANGSPEYTVSLDSDVALPVVILVFMYDPGDSSYKAIGAENVLDYTQNYRGSFSFDASNLYVQVENYTGSTITSHFIYFVGYA